MLHFITVLMWLYGHGWKNSIKIKFLDLRIGIVKKKKLIKFEFIDASQLIYNSTMY